MRWVYDIAIGAAAAAVVIGLVQTVVPSRSAAAAPAVRPIAWTGPLASPAAARPSAELEGGTTFWEPAPGYPVISPFGYRKLPWEVQGRLHQGVDIAAPAGSFVHLIADGVVVGSGAAPGYGLFVEVEHESGLRSFYAHLSAIAPYARAGAPLRAGAPIGAVGNTGSSTGAHLHLEVTLNGRPLNPIYFIGRRFEADAPLPIAEAGRIPAGVRIASVSRIPASKRELMAARDEARMAPRRIVAVSVSPAGAQPPAPDVAAKGASSAVAMGPSLEAAPAASAGAETAARGS